MFDNSLWKFCTCCQAESRTRAQGVLGAVEQFFSGKGRNDLYLTILHVILFHLWSIRQQKVQNWLVFDNSEWKLLCVKSENGKVYEGF